MARRTKVRLKKSRMADHPESSGGDGLDGPCAAQLHGRVSLPWHHFGEIVESASTATFGATAGRRYDLPHPLNPTCLLHKDCRFRNGPQSSSNVKHLENNSEMAFFTRSFLSMDGKPCGSRPRFEDYGFSVLRIFIAGNLEHALDVKAGYKFGEMTFSVYSTEQCV